VTPTEVRQLLTQALGPPNEQHWRGVWSTEDFLRFSEIRFARGSKLRFITWRVRGDPLTILAEEDRVMLEPLLREWRLIRT
jgi:hypothetical protein